MCLQECTLNQGTFSQRNYAVNLHVPAVVVHWKYRTYLIEPSPSHPPLNSLNSQHHITPHLTSPHSTAQAHTRPPIKRPISRQKKLRFCYKLERCELPRRNPKRSILFTRPALQSPFLNIHNLPRHHTLHFYYLAVYSFSNSARIFSPLARAASMSPTTTEKS